MKAAIVTLPLHTNYGGLLQAFALRTVLMRMGHDADVLSLSDGMPLPVWWKAPAVYTRRALLRLMKGNAGPEVFRELRYRKEFPAVSAGVRGFVDGKICPRVIKSYSEIREGEYDAFIVGSDQVWRPKYFGRIEDAFLAFTRGWDVLRVSYAASFGTSELEFRPEQLAACSELLAKFDAVSVREADAVGICADWFGYGDAVHVLDPVMLLEPEVYAGMASLAAASPAEGKLLSCILDMDRQKACLVHFVADAGGWDVYDASVRPHDRTVPLEDRVVPPVEQWLACIRDASFVVTDSFHVCVLCIMFHKPFIAAGNRARGLSRLTSLLGMFGLEQRLVHGIDPEDDCSFFFGEPAWDYIDSVLVEARRASYDFLRKALDRNHD